MQAIKNKLHMNKNATDASTTDNKHHLFGKHNATTAPTGNAVTTVRPADAASVAKTEAIASTLPKGSVVDRTEVRTNTFVGNDLTSTNTNTFTEISIPTAPPAPALWAPSFDERWNVLDNLTWTRGKGFFTEGWVASSSLSAPVVERVLLPTQVIEKPIAIHEEIRREQIEEIQPIVNIEKIQTEVHQVTQPLVDKEIRPVSIEQRLLPTQVLPEVALPGKGLRSASDVSTTVMRDSAAVIIEKPAIMRETDKLQVIEEIQPVLYKETVVPTVIQETKPVFQKIVEGPVYSQDTLAAKDLTSTHAMNPGYVPSREVAPAPVLERVNLPTQIVEKPMAVHEEIRKELVEEIQPVLNVEKFQTEIHQITQPMFDKEVRAVNVQKATLATQVLPDVILPGRGAAIASDMSTLTIKDTAAVVIEKPALMREVDKLQIIEEIQPVLYKETIVPTVIQETKPVYQKIVEGVQYSQETLASRDLTSTHAMNPGYVPSREVAPAPTLERVALPMQVIEKPMAVHEEIRNELIEEIQPVINVEKLQTEIHQLTQPMFDKEIKAVVMEKRILATEVLPEVALPGRGYSRAVEASTVHYEDSAAILVEKPAIVTEVDRLQIIEEIQPVLYKETIVPTVIQETKPVYQKIIEGPVYTQQTLAARDLSGSSYSHLHTSTWVDTNVAVPVSANYQFNGMSGLNLGRSPQLNRTVVVEPVAVKTFPAKAVETKTTVTTTTTAAAPQLPTYDL